MEKRDFATNDSVAHFILGEEIADFQDIVEALVSLYFYRTYGADWKKMVSQEKFDDLVATVQDGDDVFSTLSSALYDGIVRVVTETLPDLDMGDFLEDEE